MRAFPSHALPAISEQCGVSLPSLWALLLVWVCVLRPNRSWCEMTLNCLHTPSHSHSCSHSVLSQGRFVFLVSGAVGWSLGVKEQQHTHTRNSTRDGGEPMGVACIWH